MKKNIENVIAIPQGCDVTFLGGTLVVKGKGKEVKRNFLENPKIKMEKTAEGIKISAKNGTKRELKIINSIVSHIKNIFQGIETDYEYTLEICNVHFPTTVKVDGNTLRIKNFLGEKIDRVATILPNVKTVVKGTAIQVTSPDVEAAGQTAANFEIATKIRNRDRRVFQDGIFITSKPGRREE